MEWIGKRIDEYDLSSLLSLLLVGVILFSTNFLWQLYSEHQERTQVSSRFSDFERSQLKRNYQYTKLAEMYLQDILKETGSISREASINPSVTMPRHIWHKTQLEWSKVRLILQKNVSRKQRNKSTYLKDKTLTELISTTEVVDVADVFLRDVERLAISYGIPVKKAMPVPQDSILPSDVFNNLRSIGYMLDGLELIIQSPQVYESAEYIAYLLEEIAILKGIKISPMEHSELTGKRPRDVYKLWQRVHHNLGVLDEKMQADIPGGISLLPHKKGRISSNDVQELAIIVVADIEAIALSLDIDAQMPTTEKSERFVTPSDIYLKTDYALYLLEELTR